MTEETLHDRHMASEIEAVVMKQEGDEHLGRKTLSPQASM